MQYILKYFERTIVIALLALMMIAVFISTIELGITLAEQLIEPPFLLLNIDEMLKVFGFFLMVLIGLELLETIREYLKQDQVHAEVVFLVAIVAVARKVIILDYKELTREHMLGMAALILSLSVGYYLVRRAAHHYREAGKPPAPH